MKVRKKNKVTKTQSFMYLNSMDVPPPMIWGSLGALPNNILISLIFPILFVSGGKMAPGVNLGSATSVLEFWVKKNSGPRLKL